MHKVWLVAALAAGLGSATAACACEGSPVLFADHFDKIDPSWGIYGDELSVANGQMTLKPEQNTIDWQPNDHASYTDADICVTATIAKSVTADQGFVGLIFWYVDDDNFYAFEVDAAGHASIWQQTKGDWRSPVAWRDTTIVPMGDGKAMRLRVVTKGSTATAYVNDMRFDQVTATGLPAGGGKAGVIAGSPMAGVSVNVLDDFVVTKPN